MTDAPDFRAMRERNQRCARINAPSVLAAHDALAALDCIDELAAALLDSIGCVLCEQPEVLLQGGATEGKDCEWCASRRAVLTKWGLTDGEL